MPITLRSYFAFLICFAHEQAVTEAGFFERRQGGCCAIGRIRYFSVDGFGRGTGAWRVRLVAQRERYSDIESERGE